MASGDHQDTPPDLQLLCEESKTCPAGKVFVHKSILAEASTVVKDALSLLSSEKAPRNTGPSTDELKVVGDLNSWTTVLRILYSPSMPFDTFDEPCHLLNADQVYIIMPVAHRYGFEKIMSLCLQLTSRLFPGCLSCDTYSSYFIVKWINLADDLQLEQLKCVCFEKMIEMAEQKVLHSALCLNGEGDKYLQQKMASRANILKRPQMKPTRCPNGPAKACAHSKLLGISCALWCSACIMWVCSYTSTTVITGVIYCHRCGRNCPLKETAPPGQ
ncbi:hypothetical protein CEUSTIGMA_g3837.t1 [Chlamydomonas eustigma]|uniref:BTB domain-containing protein n=1 Tax=Chlamydomonas eustigma TaxID=1157962 RepID=A0A250X0H2_9CHLO|nr:hypothetical protein CEUSTIGMA_g3837.t1 [Chlamydomonas eustigma]|eukprot:GAX76392.1 hypothetical protein CEUSTIGMA_g3837.t1 [Chlamydomonas eustigma]